MPQNQIASRVHKSARDVNRVIKESRGGIKKDGNAGEKVARSDEISGKPQADYSASEIKAYELFEEGLSPLQVAIKLKIPGKVALVFNDEYLRLKSRGNLVELHGKIGNEGVTRLVSINQSIQTQNLHPENVLRVVESIGEYYSIEDDLPSLRASYRELEEKLPALKAEINMQSRILINIKKEEREAAERRDKVNLEAEQAKTKQELYDKLWQQKKEENPLCSENYTQFLAFQSVSIFDMVSRYSVDSLYRAIFSPEIKKAVQDKLAGIEDTISENEIKKMLLKTSRESFMSHAKTFMENERNKLLGKNKLASPITAPSGISH